METDHGDAEDAVARYLREQADRPLGDALLASGRTLAPFSQALGHGAENLLVKAIDALEAQDEDRATALVRRAVGLPFDEHEEVVPAAAAAHLMLFNLVTDVMEDSPDDDERWLDAALGILSDSDGPARLDVRDVLVAIAQDYDLTQNERRRLTAGIRGVEPKLRLSRIDFAVLTTSEGHPIPDRLRRELEREYVRLNLVEQQLRTVLLRASRDAVELGHRLHR